MTQAVDAIRRLSRFVETVRFTVPMRGRARRVDRLPDGRTMLLLRVIERGRGDVTVVGPRTKAMLKDASGFERAFAVQFKPGWSMVLFGVPAHELTDRYVALEDLWGRASRDLLVEHLDTTSAAGASDLVERAFARRAQGRIEPASASLARRAVRLLEETHARVESVADCLGVTARHLRRAFADNVGIGPKEFARSARLQRAVGMAATSTDWSRIAADAGYYDQAHLIADFRDLVGLTPSAFMKRASVLDPLA